MGPHGEYVGGRFCYIFWCYNLDVRGQGPVKVRSFPSRQRVGQALAAKEARVATLVQDAFRFRNPEATVHSGKCTFNLVKTFSCLRCCGAGDSGLAHLHGWASPEGCRGCDPTESMLGIVGPCVRPYQILVSIVAPVEVCNVAPGLPYAP